MATSSRGLGGRWTDVSERVATAVHRGACVAQHGQHAWSQTHLTCKARCCVVCVPQSVLLPLILPRRTGTLVHSSNDILSHCSRTRAPKRVCSLLCSSLMEAGNTLLTLNSECLRCIASHVGGRSAARLCAASKALRDRIDQLVRCSVRMNDHR
jgi:hypothetical protein